MKNQNFCLLTAISRAGQDIADPIVEQLQDGLTETEIAAVMPVNSI